ncbi:MAG TPA: hypothetical protein VKQ52_14835 [Puia sp.]|nr:hypothetical protein [Puia sp.]
MKIKDPIEEFVLLRAMKLTRLILFIGFLQVSAVTTAQRLPISIKNSALEKWFSEIEKKTD